MNDPQTWTTVWELTAEVWGGMGGGGQRGKNRNNCNKITIKIIFKKIKINIRTSGLRQRI